MNSSVRFFAAALLAVAGLPASAAAQQGAGTGGAVRLAHERLRAGNWRRVLMIGAHPDDENTELLTILSRGMGIHTAYLSLNRGSGGQNIIGDELGDALGVVRTGELLAARRVDGGAQFFTRAYDFGFSKTADETFRFWNRDSILKDMVRVIRRFRPQVIISVWSGTPADGHGHHQASGILAPEAFRAAGDPSRFPELKTQEGLEPWQPSKFYLSSWRGTANGLQFNGGVLDPAVGLTLHQIAAESRAQHRSQGQGRAEDLGPSQVGARLIAVAPGVTGPDTSLFAGIAPEAPPADDSDLAAVRLIEAGVVIDATTSREEVTPGETLPVTLSVWNDGTDTVGVVAGLLRHEGYDIAPGDCGVRRTVPPGTLYECRPEVRVDPAAPPSTPYYLRQPRQGAMYQWSGDPADWGLPFAPPFAAQFDIAVGRRASVRVRHEVQARLINPQVGEERRPVLIVPPVSVDLSPGKVLWPAGEAHRSFTVSLQNLAMDSTSAVVSLRAPRGWQVSGPHTVTLPRNGARGDAVFTVTPPADVPPGSYQLSAVAVRGRDTLTLGVQRIRYPHIEDRNIAIPAVATVVVTDIRFPRVGTIGYVRGGGDRVPEALESAGVPVTVLTGDALERGSLAPYHVIVIGPRAYEADSSLQRANPRLMRWLADGGTLLIQYQQSPYTRAGYEPVPLSIGSPTQNRVTDETAPVTLLDPASPAFTTPNRITAADFNGWIQERGLDFAASWDPRWQPLTETHDPDDPPLRGGLLVARVGAGTAIYTGFSFFRELPAVVPGAWRLFANLLALGQPATSH